MTTAHLRNLMQAPASDGDITVDEHGVEWLQILSLFVPGLPAPGGNKSASAVMRKGAPVLGKTGRPIFNMLESNNKNSREKTKAWRSVVALAARQAYRGNPLDCTLSLVVDFVMPRIKLHFRTGKHAGEMKADAPTFHRCKPDWDKLSRSTCDALTGIVWNDDSMISDVRIRKVYGAETGARITVYALVTDAEPAPVAAAKGDLFQ